MNFCMQVAIHNAHKEHGSMNRDLARLEPTTSACAIAVGDKPTAQAENADTKKETICFSDI